MPSALSYRLHHTHKKYIFPLSHTHSLIHNWNRERILILLWCSDPKHCCLARFYVPHCQDLNERQSVQWTKDQQKHTSFCGFLIVVDFIFKLISKWKFYTKKPFFILCALESRTSFIWTFHIIGWNVLFFHLINVHWMWSTFKNNKNVRILQATANEIAFLLFCNTITWSKMKEIAIISITF